jgi:uncharacterized membrane protein YsdA (DUF1294 family)
MRAYIGPIILISLGIYFLLNQLEILSFRIEDLLTFGFILIGFLMLLNSFDNPEKKGLLGGVFFLSCGAIMSLMRYHYIYPDDDFGFGAFFLSLALGNLVYFAFMPQRNINLVWGLIFGGVGAIFMAMYYGFLYPWNVWEQFEIYWPLALIIVGVVIIYNAYRNRNSVSVN